MVRGSPEKLARNNRVRELFCQGKKQYQIAMIMDISPSRVTQILHGHPRKAKKIRVAS